MGCPVQGLGGLCPPSQNSGGPGGSAPQPKPKNFEGYDYLWIWLLGYSVGISTFGTRTQRWHYVHCMRFTGEGNTGSFTVLFKSIHKPPKRGALRVNVDVCQSLQGSVGDFMKWGAKKTIRSPLKYQNVFLNVKKKTEVFFKTFF